MDFWEVITIIIVPGVSALWVWYSTRYLPAKQAREEAEANERRKRETAVIESRLEADSDTREHRQRREDLQVTYHLAEAAAAQQVMAELVANSQEGEREANRFIREDVKNDLASIIESVNRLAGVVNRLTDTEENRAKLFTLQNGILSEISQELRGQQAKISLLVDLLKENEDGSSS